jgi:hypothetical protein
MWIGAPGDSKREAAPSDQPAEGRPVEASYFFWSLSILWERG